MPVGHQGYRRGSASHQICTGLADLLVGEDPSDIRRLWDKMYRGTIYYGRFGPVIHAMSGVDLALWDIAGKAVGRPVYQLLGGAYNRKLRAYASVLFGDTPEETRRLARTFAERGFTAVKFGWGPFGARRPWTATWPPPLARGSGPTAT